MFLWDIRETNLWQRWALLATWARLPLQTWSFYVLASDSVGGVYRQIMRRGSGEATAHHRQR